MRIFTVPILALHVSLGATAALSAAQALDPPSATQPPSTMTKMEVRLSGPRIRANSPAALPKTIYVADPRFARIEDPPNSREGIQKVTIISEPDAYSVNLIDKKGVHVVHQGGENDLHLPIILPFDPAHQDGVLDRLEFGAELDFFQQAGAAQSAGPIVNAKPTDAYTLKTSGTNATLVVRGGSQIPVTLSWETKEGKYTYEYIVYKDVPFNPGLFVKPSGIVYREIPQDTSPEQS